MEEKVNGIFLTSDQIQILYDNRDYDQEDREEEVPGFEGWSVDCDTDTGEFDGEKGAMYDFEIYLYNPEGEYMGQAIGGYFNHGAGHCFNEDLTFEPDAPLTAEEEFDEFLQKVIDEGGTIKQKVKKILEHCSKLNV